VCVTEMKNVRTGKTTAGCLCPSLSWVGVVTTTSSELNDLTTVFEKVKDVRVSEGRTWFHIDTAVALIRSVQTISETLQLRIDSNVFLGAIVWNWMSYSPHSVGTSL